MAKPTEAQIKQFETAHKTQFLNLVMANRLWIKLFTQLYYKNLPKTDKQWVSLYAFGNNIAKNVGKWYVRQKNFEARAKIPAVRSDIVKYFLIPKEELKLITVANSYLDPKKETIKGLGFIPLLIWGAIVLVAAFTAFEITDELNTTAEEKADLMKATEQTLKDLNVTGPEAAKIISSTQEQASANETGGGLFGGIVPKLALAAAAIFLFMNSKKTSKANG